jgi:predicted AAA+ superfamily ATPase
MEKLIYRPILEKIESRLRKNRIIILIGARQTGKTSLLCMLKERIEKSPGKIPVLFHDCERVEYREIFSEYDAACSFIKGQTGDPDSEIHLFLDEFQKVPNIGNTLKLLADHRRNIWVVASGSSSIEIRMKLDESLAGRKRIYEVFPLCFEEFLNFTEHPEAASYRNYVKEPQWAVSSLYRGAFEEYVIYGGLPRIPREKMTEEKKSELKEIYDSYLLRDIKSYIREEKTVPFNRLLKILAAQCGNLVSIDELAGTLRIKREETEEFLHILEQTYIIYFLQPFSSNLRKELTRKRKVFFYDTGLRNSIMNSFSHLDARPDAGALFENAVISELIKNKGANDSFFFWQTQQGTEVDLVVKREEKIIPVEIKMNLTSLKKLRGMRSFCGHYGIPKAFVITNKMPGRMPEQMSIVPACFAENVLRS